MITDRVPVVKTIADTISRLLRRIDNEQEIQND